MHLIFFFQVICRIVWIVLKIQYLSGLFNLTYFSEYQITQQKKQLQTQGNEI